MAASGFRAKLWAKRQGVRAQRMAWTAVSALEGVLPSLSRGKMEEKERKILVASIKRTTVVGKEGL